MMAINMKSNADGGWGASSCNLHICLPMLPYDRWQWHTHTYTHVREYLRTCVHCSSRQMTVEWQRANKTHVKNRTCNEQNKPQRQRERERDMKREGQHRRRRPAWLSFFVSPSFSFFCGLKISPDCQKIKSCPYLGKFAANLPPPLQRATRERERKRERQRERARARVYCKSALA